jgi:hypothetical protein
MWLLVVAAGHAALFYLFRVAAPLTSRKPPSQHAVLFLPPDEPAVRSFLGALEDRFPGALLRSEDHDLRSDMAALAKAAPPSEPLWASHRPALKPFTEPLVPQELPALVQPGEPVLPEIETGELPAVPAAEPVRPVLSVVVDEAPGGRVVEQPPRWPEKLVDETWPVAGSVPFMLGVGPNGRPEFCLPVSPASGLDLEALRRPLMAMRFTPKAGGLQWITVVVRW